jgi:predicted esterase
MREHHLAVRRTARYYSLGDIGPGTARVGFVCHGYRQLAGRFLKSFRPLDDGRTVLFAPEGLARFYLGATLGEHGPDARIGASWMTREDREREIDDYVAYLDALYERELGGADRGAAEVFALGFSQGAATASRWAAQGKAPLDRLILWGGLLPPDLDLAANRERLDGLQLTIVAGTGDPFITQARLEKEQARLGAHGIASRFVRFDGGHVIDAGTLKEILTA